jgi:hypothetical protein
MRLAVSGTYSSGKTTVAVGLEILTGIPRTQAKTMREILPYAVPGKRLEECDAGELVELGLRRLVDRVARESQLPGDFISDGSSLHEWVYGKVRVRFGLNPEGALPADEPPQIENGFFEQVIDHMGAVMKDHAVRSYDAFVHLPIEFPLVADGHRPISEGFRRLSDELLLATLEQLGIRYDLVGGTIEQRLDTIARIHGLPRLMPVEEAARTAVALVEKMGIPQETGRAPAAAR